MDKGRRHWGFGLLGFYLLAITAFLLDAGIFQTTNLISAVRDIGVFSTPGVSQEVVGYFFRMYASGFLVSFLQLAAGALGLICFIRLPSAKYLKALAFLLGLIQVCVIIRDRLFVMTGISTFTYIHRTLLIMAFAKAWGRYIDEGNASASKGYFPFIRAFMKHTSD